MPQSPSAYDSASSHYQAGEKPLLLPILSTKLHPPPLPPNPVQRPRLLAQLNQGLTCGHKLALVVAPAGFGKTNMYLWSAAEIEAIYQYMLTVRRGSRLLAKAQLRADPP